MDHDHWESEPCLYHFVSKHRNQNLGNNRALESKTHFFKEKPIEHGSSDMHERK